MPLLDSLPTPVRHLVLMAVAAFLAVELPVVQTDLPTYHLPSWLASTLGVAIPYAILWVSKINGQYGRGSTNGDPFVPDLVAAADPAPADPATPPDQATSGA